MKVPVTNSTKMAMFLAGVMIPPGETKHFEEHHVSPELRPQPEMPEPEEIYEDPVVALLGGTIPEIAEALPALSAQEYAALKAAEEAGENRKGLVTEFAAEDLRRADVGAEENAGE